MDRKKPPALTSPWKVGFLVALMLVVTGLGVGYFISGSFGLKWNWIELGGASPATWAFHFDAFVEEMVPLIALVILLAAASYVLVSGAVKRYTRFVDSGVEYKQLLRSIKSIDDLEDEERLERLKQHPELREFLMGFKNRMAARERQLSEREKRPNTPRESNAAGRNLPAECGLLVSAIMNGKAGFSSELALTIPELKQIERAAREQLTRDAPAATELDTLRSRVSTTVEAVKTHGAGIRRDTDACVAGVREMEKMLSQLRRAIETPQESAVATKGVATAAKQLDAMAESLTGLGEETRRIAIAAALEASGGGESIKIAEEVRTIATRFNAVAAQWKQAGPALRTGIATIEKGASSTAQRRKSLSAAAAKVAASAQMWGERLVALQEQVRELEMAAGIQMDVGAAREWGTIDSNFDYDNAGTTSEPDVAEVETHEEAGAEMEPVADETGTEVEAEVTGASEEFESATPTSVFEESPKEEETQFADIPGFEREQRVFNERLAEAQASASTDGLEVEPESADVYDEAAMAVEPEAPAATEASAPPAPDDGFLTGPRGAKPKPAAKAGPKPAPKIEPRPVAEPAPARRPPAKIAPVEIEDEVEEDGRIDIDADVDADVVAEVEVVSEVEVDADVDVDVDVDADAYDLYTIGAVDFVEGVHA